MTLVQIKNNYDRAAENLDQFRFSGYGINFRWVELRRDGTSKFVPAEAISQQAKELESQRNSAMEKVFPGITRAVDCRRFWQFLPMIETMGMSRIEQIANFKNSRKAFEFLDFGTCKKNEFYSLWKICRFITGREGTATK